MGKARYIYIKIVLGILLCGYVISAGALAWSGLHDHLGNADVMLVLGSALNADGTPSKRLQSRLDRAVEQERETPVKTILVSGGLEKNGCDEAESMADYLADHGIDRTYITLDHQGWTTYDSARNTAQLLKNHGWRGVIIVTQYFHIPRTRMALRRWGVDPIFSVHARRMEFRDVYALAREVAGWITYHFKAYR